MERSKNVKVKNAVNLKPKKVNNKRKLLQYVCNITAKYQKDTLKADFTMYAQSCAEVENLLS